MTNNFGRTMGVSIVGMGLLALVISAPAGDQSIDLGDRAADQIRGQTGDRIPQATLAADSVADAWSAASRRAAHAVAQKYGDPDEISEGRLVWHNTGPFKKTVVYKEELPHNFPTPHVDVIEQFIDYRVPLDKHDDLARFNGSMRADRTAGLLSARGESERDNFIALNLAHEIILGKRTVDDARQAYARAAALVAAGKTSPYTKGMLFKTSGRGQPDPDHRDCANASSCAATSSGLSIRQ